MSDDSNLHIPIEPDQLSRLVSEAPAEDPGRQSREEAEFDAGKQGAAPGSHEEQRLRKEIEKLEEDVRGRREANDSQKQDREQRKLVAENIYKLVVGWLCSLLVLICAAATKGFTQSFWLSEKTLLLLIGGTTVDVFGLFYVVANYLFPKQPK